MILQDKKNLYLLDLKMRNTDKYTDKQCIFLVPIVFHDLMKFYTI